MGLDGTSAHTRGPRPRSTRAHDGRSGRTGAAPAPVSRTRTTLDLADAGRRAGLGATDRDQAAAATLLHRLGGAAGAATTWQTAGGPLDALDVLRPALCVELGTALRWSRLARWTATSSPATEVRTPPDLALARAWTATRRAGVACGPLAGAGPARRRAVVARARGVVAARARRTRSVDPPLALPAVLGVVDDHEPSQPLAAVVAATAARLASTGGLLLGEHRRLVVEPGAAEPIDALVVRPTAAGVRAARRESRAIRRAVTEVAAGADPAAVAALDVVLGRALAPTIARSCAVADLLARGGPEVVVLAGAVSPLGRATARLASRSATPVAVVEAGEVAPTTAWDDLPVDLTCTADAARRDHLVERGQHPDRVLVSPTPAPPAAAPRPPGRPLVVVAPGGPGPHVALDQHLAVTAVVRAAADRLPDLRWAVLLDDRDEPRRWLRPDGRQAAVELVPAGGVSAPDAADRLVAGAAALVSVASPRTAAAHQAGTPVVHLTPHGLAGDDRPSWLGAVTATASTTDELVAAAQQVVGRVGTAATPRRGPRATSPADPWAATAEALADLSRAPAGLLA